MYIPGVVVGVVGTILVEGIILLIVAVIKAEKENKDKWK